MPTPNAPNESTPHVTRSSTMPEGDLSQGLGARCHQPSGLPSSASADPVPPSVAARLRAARVSLFGERSASKMARALGISQKNYWHFEVDRRPTLDLVVRLWKRFGISPEWMLRGTGENSMNVNRHERYHVVAAAIRSSLLALRSASSFLNSSVAASIASIVRPSFTSKFIGRSCGRQDIPPNLPPQPVEVL